MDGSDGGCASTHRLSPAKRPATDPSGVELRRSPRRSSFAGSAPAPPQRRSESPDSEGDGVATPASQKSRTRELDSEFADARTPPDVKNMGGTDKMPNQKNIIQIRGYNLAVCAFVMNIGKTTKKSYRGDRLRDKYKVQVKEFAALYITYMMHAHGGKKTDIWLDGKDAGWLERRLLSKTNNCEVVPDKELANYLWDQYQLVRGQIEREAETAWNAATKNGTQIILSGSDIFRTHDRWLQHWFEQTSLVGDTELAKQKQEMAGKWKAHQPADPSAAVCPLHGETCKHGRMPPNWLPLGAAYFTSVRMGPIADMLGDALNAGKAPDSGIFPPFATDPDYLAMFPCKSRSGPPPTGEDGGAQVEDARGGALSRRSLDLKEEQARNDQSQSWNVRDATWASAAAAFDRYDGGAQKTASTSVLQVQTTTAELKEEAGAIVNMFSALLQFIVQTFHDPVDQKRRLGRLADLQGRVEHAYENASERGAAVILNKVKQVQESEHSAKLAMVGFQFASFKDMVEDGQWPWEQ
jgi:hypothetical protein